MSGYASIKRRPQHGDIYVEKGTGRVMVVLSNSSTEGMIPCPCGCAEDIRVWEGNPAISGYYADTNEQFAGPCGWFNANATYQKEWPR